MNREPLFKRQVRGLLRWLGIAVPPTVEDVTELATRETKSGVSPAQRLESITQGQRRQTNLVKRQVLEVIERGHDRLDQQNIDSLNRTLASTEVTYDHAISLRTKDHKLRHLDHALDREEELEAVRHEARMAAARQRVAAADPELEALRRETESETLRAQGSKERATRRYYDTQPQARGTSPGTPEDDGATEGQDETERARRESARSYVNGVDGQ